VSHSDWQRGAPARGSRRAPPVSERPNQQGETAWPHVSRPADLLYAADTCGSEKIGQGIGERVAGVAFPRSYGRSLGKRSTVPTSAQALPRLQRAVLASSDGAQAPGSGRARRTVGPRERRWGDARIGEDRRGGRGAENGGSVSRGLYPVYAHHSKNVAWVVLIRFG
jgi:hypothetical protein